MTLHSDILDYESILPTLGAFSAASRKITMNKHGSADINKVLHVANAGSNGEAEVMVELREHLAEDIQRRADQSSSGRLLDRNDGPRRVNVSALSTGAQDAARELLLTSGYQPVKNLGDVQIKSLNDISTLKIKHQDRGRSDTGAQPLLAPSVNLPDHFVSFDMDPSLAHLSSGRMTHGGVLHAHGKRYCIISARTQLVRHVPHLRGHNSSTVSTQIFELDRSGNLIKPAFNSLHRNSMCRGYFWSQQGLNRHLMLTQQGQKLGWAMGGVTHMKFKRRYGPPNEVVYPHSITLHAQVRTRAIMDRLSWIASRPSVRSLMRIKTLKFDLPGQGSKTEIADAVDKTSPFNAFFDPDIRGQSGLAIYTSPYLKIFSAGAENGPTIAVFLDALNYYDQHKSHALSLDQHRHCMVVFDRGTPPILMGLDAK